MRFIIRFPPSHLDTHFGWLCKIPTWMHQSSCNLICFYFIHLLIFALIRCLNAHVRFRTFSVVFIHDYPDNGPPLDPAPLSCTLFCLVPLPPLVIPVYSTSFVLCAHPQPFDHLFTYLALYSRRIRNIVHMLLPTGALPWLLCWARPSASAVLLNQPKTV